MGIAMRFQPLLRRRCAHEGFEITTRMDALPTPICGGKKRHGNLLEIGRAFPVIVVVEWMLDRARDDVAAVLFQLLKRERLRACDRLVGHAAARAALADAMLHRDNRARIPVRDEFGIDASVVTGLAVMGGRAFPRTHRRQMRRRELRYQPRVHCEIRDTDEPYLAAGPALRGRPFDAVIKILSLARRPGIDVTGRAPSDA